MLLPEGADIDGFAVWDDLTRIPGVILEKVKAKKLFEEIARASIDPGLLSSDEEPAAANEFTARVVPIAPFGGKRLELSCRWPAPIEQGRLDFVLPLQPNNGQSQRIGKLVIEIVMDEDLPLKAVAFHNSHLVPEITTQSERGFVARLEAHDVALDEDLSFTAELELADADVKLTAYRDVDTVDWNISPSGGHWRDDVGYFLARVLFPPRPAEQTGPRRVLLVVDGSLSMLGDKLNRAVELAGGLAGALAPTDLVTLLYHNTEVSAAAGPFQPATPERRAELDSFLRKQRLAGGLDLAGALQAAGSLCATEQAGLRQFVVLLSDGWPTAGELRHAKIVEALKKSPLLAERARLFTVGVGDDANRTLLIELAATADGHYAWCPDTADAGALAKTVAARLSAAMMRHIELLLAHRGNIVDAYPAAIPPAFAGSEAAVVGRYRQPGSETITLRYDTDAGPAAPRTFQVELPAKTTDHDDVRRRWAKARVDELLARIKREGEKREWVDEIIALSKRFTMVTPYTSFLAAPRALLRPRVIRPGDPILRVRTPADIVSVTAIFPFGLTAPLSYLADEEVWQVRFLAPPSFPDGEYACRLVLVDRDGRQYVEAKSFTLDSRAPTVRPAMDKRLPAGGKARIAVFADADTRRLTARLPYTAAAPLTWDEQAKASVGWLEIPAGAPPGPAKLEIYAEDFAANVSRTAIDVEVVHEN
jgi:Ca-activated chloride channel family protein